MSFPAWQPPPPTVRCRQPVPGFINHESVLLPPGLPQPLNPLPGDTQHAHAQTLPSEDPSLAVLESLVQLESLYLPYTAAVQHLLLQAQLDPYPDHSVRNRLVHLCRTNISNAERLHRLYGELCLPTPPPNICPCQAMTTGEDEEASSSASQLLFTEDEMEELEAIPGILDLAAEMGFDLTSDVTSSLW